ARHESIAACEGMRERTIVVSGHSKSFSMTGWRLGYLVAPPPVIEAATKFQGHINSSPPAAFQRAALAALELDASEVDRMAREFEARRDAFVEELTALPEAGFVRPRGAFYIFVDFSQYGYSDVDLATHLIRTAKVSSVPGSGFGRQGRGYLRFSFVRSRDEIRTGVRRIAEVLAGSAAATRS
ncbi:MAG: aminotransferase class I/II-fold pyridoxal phosphate-dependent enzyme, partial [Chloroflexi bacterium]|nr:aminotransferase class I/II-fold pyridoxal phosphate-dependent enzyme [Chloroflexota bacterium]